MRNLSLRAGAVLHHSPRPSNPACSASSNPPPLFVKVVASGLNKHHSPSKFAISLSKQAPTPLITLNHTTPENGHSREECDSSRVLMLGAVSVGIMVLLSGLDEQKAWALGPEGPLVEEFWDNVRRYGLYALTVSTGAIYSIVEPIVELLKNPISAILIIAILGGSFYIVSQVVSAMVGITDFNYQYGN